MRMFPAIAFLFSFAAFGEPLKTYNIDDNLITVSGVSSGGYMAVQLQVAFSRIFSGAGSVAGGPFWCAEGNFQKAFTRCMGTPNKTAPINSIHKAKELAAAGGIDPLENLIGRRIYLYSSPNDYVIHASQGDRTEQFFAQFTSVDLIKKDSAMEAAHGFLTLEYGAACNTAASPYLLSCGYDQAKEILRHLYGPLKDKGIARVANLIEFDQTDFGDAKTPLFKSGWVYAPSSCASGETCALHVALHGCSMNPDFIGDQFATHAGYNDWAETNGIVVIYPQSAKLDSNRLACWDWIGFTGSNYAEQTGSQMAAIKKMIDRIRGE